MIREAHLVTLRTIAPVGERSELTVHGRRWAVVAAGTDPRPYRDLTGRSHPQIRRMRALYRARRGKRGWRRAAR